MDKPKCPKCKDNLIILRTTIETERVYVDSFKEDKKNEILYVGVMSTSGIDTEEESCNAYCNSCDYKISVELEW